MLRIRYYMCTSEFVLVFQVQQPSHIQLQAGPTVGGKQIITVPAQQGVRQMQIPMSSGLTVQGSRFQYVRLVSPATQSNVTAGNFILRTPASCKGILPLLVSPCLSVVVLTKIFLLYIFYLFWWLYPPQTKFGGGYIQTWFFSALKRNSAFQNVRFRSILLRSAFSVKFVSVFGFVFYNAEDVSYYQSILRTTLNEEITHR